MEKHNKIDQRSQLKPETLKLLEENVEKHSKTLVYIMTSWKTILKAKQQKQNETNGITSNPEALYSILSKE